MGRPSLEILVNHGCKAGEEQKKAVPVGMEAIWHQRGLDLHKHTYTDTASADTAFCINSLQHAQTGYRMLWCELWSTPEH